MTITAIEEQKKNKKRRSVFVDGEFSFGIGEPEIHLLGLREGDEISPAELLKIKQTALVTDAKNLALKYLAYSMRTEREVRLKLKTYDIDEDISAEVITFLAEHRYIDDSDYAEKYIAEKRRTGYGDMRIKSELYRKGIDSEIISAALEDPGDDAPEKILLLLEKKIKSGTEAEFNKQERQKIYNFLNSRGFTYTEAKTALRIYWDKMEVDE